MMNKKELIEQVKEQKQKLYNILVDFALEVDRCHKNGVEPSCEEEIIKIIDLFNKEKGTMKDSQKISLLGTLILGFAAPSMNPDDYTELERILISLEEHLKNSPSEN